MRIPWDTLLKAWIGSSRDPELFWRLSLCQVVFTLDALTGGRRRTATGKTWRKATPDDFRNLVAMAGSQRGARKLTAAPEGAQGAPVT